MKVEQDLHLGCNSSTKYCNHSSQLVSFELFICSVSNKVMKFFRQVNPITDAQFSFPYFLTSKWIFKMSSQPHALSDCYRFIHTL